MHRTFIALGAVVWASLQIVTCAMGMDLTATNGFAVVFLGAKKGAALAREDLWLGGDAGGMPPIIVSDGPLLRMEREIDWRNWQ